MASKNNQASVHDLLSLSFELTVYGVIMCVILAMTASHFDASEVVMVCMTLAVIFIFRMLWPVQRLSKYLWYRLGAIAACGVFAWFLIYEAENTRAGWYRKNILQHRVHAFVQNAPAYVIVADEHGIITTTSNNIDVLVGYTQQELIGQSVKVLMRAEAVIKHDRAFKKAVEKLKRNGTQDAGWALQGVVIVGVKHKDGHIVPVKAFAGGVRWSADVQFDGDTDIFAVFVPSSAEEAKGNDSTIPNDTDIRVAPPAPPVTPIAPLPKN